MLISNAYIVKLTNQAKKDIKKAPYFIVVKLWAWVNAINEKGLNEVRKVKGFHDEPLKGKRIGERSVRLSKAYRVIYAIDKNGNTEIIKILRVNKHEY